MKSPGKIWLYVDPRHKAIEFSGEISMHGIHLNDEYKILQNGDDQLELTGPARIEGRGSFCTSNTQTNLATQKAVGTWEVQAVNDQGIARSRLKIDKASWYGRDGKLTSELEVTRNLNHEFRPHEQHKHSYYNKNGLKEKEETILLDTQTRQTSKITQVSFREDGTKSYWVTGRRSVKLPHDRTHTILGKVDLRRTVGAGDDLFTHIFKCENNLRDNHARTTGPFRLIVLNSAGQRVIELEPTHPVNWEEDLPDQMPYTQRKFKPDGSFITKQVHMVKHSSGSYYTKVVPSPADSKGEPSK